MPQTEEVSGLVRELDSFYELVDIHTGEPVASGSRESPEGVASQSPPQDDITHSSLDESVDSGDSSEYTDNHIDSSKTQHIPLESSIKHNGISHESVRVPDIVTSDSSTQSHSKWTIL